MKRVFVILLTVFCLFPSTAYLDSLDDRLSSLTYEIIRASREGNFEFISERMHEQALEDFRRIIRIRMDQLTEMFSVVEVETVIGINIEELERLSDKEFFNTVCSLTLQRYGERMTSPDYVLHEPIGHVSEEGGWHHVLYRVPTEIEGESDRLHRSRPSVITFYEDANEFKLATVMYERLLPRIWYGILTDRDVTE